MINMRNFYALLATLVAGIAAYTFVPPPQHARAQFVSQQNFAGTATGTNNNINLVIPNMSTPVAGIPITFNPLGGVNSTNVVVSINSGTAVPLLRPSSIGAVALSGSEIRGGIITAIMFDGTNWILQYPVDPRPIGDTIQFRGNAVPPGYLIEDGSCVSQALYAPLFSVIGTNYGSCAANLFALPDSRGTSFVALDGQGANGNANRITTACGTYNSPGSICGKDTSTITTPMLPPYAPSGNVSGTISGGATNGQVATTNILTGGNIVMPTIINGSADGRPLTVTGNFAGTLAGFSQGGSSQPYSILNPISLGRRAIKY